MTIPFSHPFSLFEPLWNHHLFNKILCHLNFIWHRYIICVLIPTSFLTNLWQWLHFSASMWPQIKIPCNHVIALCYKVLIQMIIVMILIANICRLFIYIWIISFNFHINPLRKMLLLLLFYRWGNRGSEKFNSILKSMPFKTLNS